MAAKVQLIFMARIEENHYKAISYELASWISPEGVSERISSLFVSEADQTIDPVTQDVLAIFDEGQALVDTS